MASRRFSWPKTFGQIVESRLVLSFFNQGREHDANDACANSLKFRSIGRRPRVCSWSLDEGRGKVSEAIKPEREIMITVGFRKIGSGAVATGGEQVVLHASADDGNANILFPAEEIPRLVALLIQLLGDARRERFKSGSVEAHILDLKRL